MYCLPDENKFPLNSREDTIAALDYFSAHYQKLSPTNRRIFSSNVLTKVAEYKLEATELTKMYGAKTLGNRLDYAKDIRKAMLDPEKGKDLDSLFKLASNASGEALEKVAFALVRFDNLNSLSQFWNQGIPDPYESLLARFAAVERYVVGSTSATRTQLLQLAEDPRRLQSRFSKNFIEMFRSNPISVFKNAEVEEQKIILRLAEGLIQDGASDSITVK